MISWSKASVVTNEFPAQWILYFVELLVDTTHTPCCAWQLETNLGRGKNVRSHEFSFNCVKNAS